jgi:hypothetical protein
MPEEKMREIRISIPEDLCHLVIPDKAVDHLIQAKKEMLLVLRSFIDARIEAIEKRDVKKEQKKKKVKID